MIITFFPHFHFKPDAGVLNDMRLRAENVHHSIFKFESNDEIYCRAKVSSQNVIKIGFSIALLILII